MEIGVLIDVIEERAAIIEEGEKCSRQIAENHAARLHGFADWAAFQARVWAEKKSARPAG